MATNIARKTPAGSAAAVLDHVDRYHMAVFDTVRRLPELKRLGHKQIKRLIGQLCQQGRLGQGPLYHNRKYLFPMARAQAAKHAQRGGPLSEPAKIHHYAILLFCHLKHTRRRRLTKEDFQTHFPELDRPGLPMNYYVDLSPSGPRLGLVRVDRGGPGRWDRLLRRCHRDLCAHAARPPFQPFIQGGALEMTLITYLPQKAERLRRSLTLRTDLPPQAIRIVVLPELLNLVAPQPG